MNRPIPDPEIRKPGEPPSSFLEATRIRVIPNLDEVAIQPAVAPPPSPAPAPPSGPTTSEARQEAKRNDPFVRSELGKFEMFSGKVLRFNELRADRTNIFEIVSEVAGSSPRSVTLPIHAIPAMIAAVEQYQSRFREREAAKAPTRGKRGAR